MGWRQYFQVNISSVARLTRTISQWSKEGGMITPSHSSHPAVSYLTCPFWKRMLKHYTFFTFKCYGQPHQLKQENLFLFRTSPDSLGWEQHEISIMQSKSCQVVLRQKTKKGLRSKWQINLSRSRLLHPTIEAISASAELIVLLHPK